MNNNNQKHEPNNTELWLTFAGLSGLMIYTIYELIQSITVSTQIIG